MTINSLVMSHKLGQAQVAMEIQKVIDLNTRCQHVTQVWSMILDAKSSRATFLT